MIRVVVAALLALAILAAAMPAIESARQDRTEAQVEAAIDDIDEAAVDLTRSEEPVKHGPGAKRVVTVKIPAAGFAAADVEYLRIGADDGRYEFRIEDRRQRARHGRIPVHGSDGEPVVLSEPGTHRLALRLVADGSGTRVVVERL